MNRRVFPLVFVLFDLVLFAAIYLVLVQARAPRDATSSVNDVSANLQSALLTPTPIAISMLDTSNQPLTVMAMDRDGQISQDSPVDTISIAQLLMVNTPQPGSTPLPALADSEQTQNGSYSIGDLVSAPIFNGDMGILPTLTPSPTPNLPRPMPTKTAATPLAVAQAVRPKVVPVTPPPPFTTGGDGCAPHGFPVQGILTQRFTGYHPGMDLAVDLGTSVVATHTGKVIFAGWRWDGYGNLVIIQNGRFVTFYAHNTSVAVTVGQIVHAGDIIARSGSTGWSSGPHVHYETHIDNVAVDPTTIEARHLPSC